MMLAQEQENLSSLTLSFWQDDLASFLPFAHWSWRLCSYSDFSSSYFHSSKQLEHGQ
jgi:hypothetical protein